MRVFRAVNLAYELAQMLYWLADRLAIWAIDNGYYGLAVDE